MMSRQSLTTASASPVKALRRLMPASLTRIEIVPIFRHLGGDRAAGRLIGDVEGHVLRLAAGVADVGGRPRRGLAVDVERHDLRALAAEPERDGAADPGARAGDRRDVVVQESVICDASRRWVERRECSAEMMRRNPRAVVPPRTRSRPPKRARAAIAAICGDCHSGRRAARLPIIAVSTPPQPLRTPQETDHEDSHIPTCPRRHRGDRALGGECHRRLRGPRRLSRRGRLSRCPRRAPDELPPGRADERPPGRTDECGPRQHPPGRGRRQPRRPR